MALDLNKLRDNLAAVEERIGNACARSGRRRADVTLIAVTKSVAPDIAALVPELGILDLGENRPQELWRRAEALPKNIRWHLIGHLQRNKIDKTLPLAHRIHAVDSVRLLKAIEQEAVKQQRRVSVLLEVNASGEAAKQGFAPAELVRLAPNIKDLQQVQVQGLMTMAALQEPEACRPTFITLRKLRDVLELEHLSMGMSNDFEIAIEEGATFIRLGTVLFQSEPEA